jgi:sugar/nucleoside kinase (ribokinase family)
MPIRRITGILCCGNICFDMPVWPVDKLAWGTTVWVEEITECIGGNGANTSYTLAMLGVPVRLMGVAGRDDRGDKLIEELARAGVDTSRISRSEGPTTCTVCIVNSSGDRLFLHKPGTSSDLEASSLSFQDSAGFSHFHLANPFALPTLRQEAWAVLARARQAGLTTSLDTGWDARGRWIEDIGPCLPHTDLLFVNESEAQMLSGERDPEACVVRLRSLGTSNVVVKLGARGCIVFWGKDIHELPAFPARVKDTTGAGDCFAGAYLAALHGGRNVRDAARLANAAGAMSVEHLGGVQGVRSMQETEQWMEERSTL